MSRWETATADGSLLSFDMLIDGKPVTSGDGRRFDVSNPYLGEAWASVPDAGPDDVDRAVSAARRAFDDGPWRTFTPAARARVLRSLGALIERHGEELAVVQSRENGKLLRELVGQTRGLAGHCTFFAGVAETMHGRTVPSSAPDMFTYTVREPIGVVAALTPWNSPLALLAWKLCPALAAGNTMVVKPSEVSPVSTILLAELALEAGLPEGVLNVVTGGPSTGAALTSHGGVDKVAFTGSTAVGKEIARSAADRLLRVSLELGGKSPNIVFADADPDAAVTGVLAGIFAATGQTCLAGSRVLVQDEVYDAFAARVVERAAAIRLGDPLAQDTQMGPVASEAQYRKVLDAIALGVDEGARLLSGGGPPKDPRLQGGLFVEPTVFGDVRNDMRIAQEEIFGPVVCLLRFGDEQDAIRIANDSRYGLAAGVWTRDVQRAHRVAHALRAGTVWVNTYRKTSYAMPFGGMKESGLGRENGWEAIDEYTETKGVWVDLGASIADPFDPRG